MFKNIDIKRTNGSCNDRQCYGKDSDSNNLELRTQFGCSCKLLLSGFSNKKKGHPGGEKKQMVYRLDRRSVIALSYYIT